jgi:hypothetical protein
MLLFCQMACGKKGTEVQATAATAYNLLSRGNWFSKTNLCSLLNILLIKIVVIIFQPETMFSKLLL